MHMNVLLSFESNLLKICSSKRFIARRPLTETRWIREEKTRYSKNIGLLSRSVIMDEENNLILRQTGIRVCVYKSRCRRLFFWDHSQISDRFFFSSLAWPVACSWDSWFTVERFLSFFLVDDLVSCHCCYYCWWRWSYQCYPCLM